ncbi:MAG: hypothetical protein K6T80_06210 [Firmicutes bacterium]|nr:hypothetical protein [Bacillota bacterium]
MFQEGLVRVLVCAKRLIYEKSMENHLENLSELSNGNCHDTCPNILYCRA